MAEKEPGAVATMIRSMKTSLTAPRGSGAGRRVVGTTVRATVTLLLILPAPLRTQQPPPRLMYVYRDSVKSGVDSIYRAIEDEGAQICADLKCPNPYLALESLSGPHEAWWLNAFASEVDTTRVVKAYATNRPLTEALGAVVRRKGTLIGTPIQGFGVYRSDLSRGPGWSVAGARFMLVTVTRRRQPVEGTVWQLGDSTLYVFRPVRTLEQAKALGAHENVRIFAVRPNWSMPAPAWVAADPGFWRLAPVPRPRH
jgi:hypothetical protein